MKRFCTLKNSSLCLGFLLLLASCTDEPSSTANDSESSLALKTKPSVVTDFYALSAGTILDKISTANPKSVITSAAVTGLQTDETILSIDFRPATGQLYGLGSSKIVCHQS